MALASSRQTIVANITQQASAVVTLLILPNVLVSAAFAETVYVGMLLSFIAMADLGLSRVYSRVVPALIGRGDSEAITHWDRTVYNFGFLTALLFAVVISLSYFAKFHSSLHALLLFPVAPLTFLASFYISRISCMGDFLTYKRMTMLRAALSAGVLPLVYLWGVTGWFAGSLLASAVLLVYVRKGPGITFFAVDWQLVRLHVGEGLLLCGIVVVWVQLLNVGRLYASTHYSHAEIAEYGIVSSAYQSLAALIISALLPVSVETLRRYGHSADDAMDYVHKVGERVAPWILLGAIVAAEVSPIILKWTFPAYHLDSTVVASLLLGVIFYPFFIAWGNCMVGARRFFPYIGSILFGLASAWLVATYFGSDKRGAAIGQFIGLMMYSLAMYLLAPKVLNVSAKLWRRAMLVFMLTVGLGAVYLLLRWM